jgi:hypothetical protein
MVVVEKRGTFLLIRILYCINNRLKGTIHLLYCAREMTPHPQCRRKENTHFDNGESKGTHPPVTVEGNSPRW